ncbi:MAG: class I SAM-dependent methyltransferase [Candidatus Methanomethylicaceae archaeon]
MYVPRPSDVDLQKKYEFLTAVMPPPKEVAPTPIDRLRAEQLFNQVSKALRNKPGSVLDFGGGDGRMLTVFAERGWDCSVIDFTPVVFPKVRWLGSSLSAIDASKKFDLIICSHVLEHLFDPLETLRELAQHLQAGSLLYVEVPLEVWKGPPKLAEPVTHVNFFTPGSLQNLLNLAGFRALTRIGWAYHSVAGKICVIRAWARLSDKPCKAKILDVYHYLSPGWIMRLRLLLTCPHRLSGLLRRLVRWPKVSR